MQAVSSIAADTHSQKNAENCNSSQMTVESSQMPETDEACRSEERAASSVEQENIDEDDLPTGQMFHIPADGDKLPPVILREVDKDGKEKIISDHSTSAGFTFQNTLMYELD